MESHYKSMSDEINEMKRFMKAFFRRLERKIENKSEDDTNNYQRSKKELERASTNIGCRTQSQNNRRASTRETTSKEREERKEEAYA